MQVRRLTQGDLMASAAIGSISFLYPLDEANYRAEVEAGRVSTDGRWGCFADSGELAASIHNNRFDIHYDGSVVRMGGIGGVCTLPEHRYGGAVRRIFEQLLPAARAEGEVFSMLYPFNHEFYRKFGYELCDEAQNYKFPLAQLAGYKFAGAVRPLKLDREHPDDVKLVTALYNRFAARYNASIRRDDERTMGMGAARPLKEQTFCYLLGPDDRPAAYLRYRMNTEDNERVLHVTDYAIDGRAGLLAMLGFLGRMSSDFRHCRIRLPIDVPLASLLPNPYDVERKVGHSLMVRATNAAEALARIAMPEGVRVAVRVTDEFMPQNTGTYCVGGGAAAPTDRPADIILSARALGPLCLGYLGLHEAALRPDVSIVGNEEALAATFAKKPLYQSDHY